MASFRGIVSAASEYTMPVARIATGLAMSATPKSLAVNSNAKIWSATEERYSEVLASIFALIRTHPVLRQRMALGFLGMACFSLV